ncbi:Protein translocase subunit SecD [Candidatus Bealeia paramacronuclearis]|uniref:Protein translocase subunit SecD n=1 Tax=Candidatus Bealeia paramacronuclearis TaxID=1921001 RepID=A0ABZ2C5E7_9PROT|nr:Protein translocase subunit SecD [Candidatus Bealeia paramacronuclearis]
MLYIPRWKEFFIFAVCLIGIWFSLPNFFSEDTVKEWPTWMPKKQVVLGLDLRGGAHLLLEVDLATVQKEQMTTLMDAVRTTLRKDRIGYTGLKVQGESVILTLRDSQDADKAKKLIRESDRDIEIAAGENGQLTLTLSGQAIAMRKKRALEQSIEIVRRRVDETGTSEPMIQQQGDDRILVQMPGLQDPTRIKNLLGQTAKLQFRLVDLSGSLEEALKGHVPPGSEQLPDLEKKPDGTPKTYYLIQKQVKVSGENLVDARPGFDDYNRPSVNFALDSLGAKKFADVTKENVGKPFAIVLDGKVASAPVINGPIPGGHANITGHFTVQDTQDLALLLRAGALPAPLKIVEERTVGPGLGADSINAGIHGTLISIALVVVFMFLAYSFFGFVANMAVLFNLVLLMAAMSVTQATLTLPGIAGIALAIGMAVDANVLINERIKEELRLGRKFVSAIDAGYSRAMATIVDSNLTTLIGTTILYQFGSGPIRGFAVTISLGILISMFTAVSLTKLVVAYWIRWRRPTKISI